MLREYPDNRPRPRRPVKGEPHDPTRAHAVEAHPPIPTRPHARVGALSGVVAAGALAQSAGKSLIGKLEGPEVVTDAAQIPKTFKEAPQLAELVKAGKLPPVAERIGQDPLVIKPVHEIGKYGGTWRRGFTGPADTGTASAAASGPDHLLFWDYTGDKVVPNIAKGCEMQDGGRTSTRAPAPRA